MDDWNSMLFNHTEYTKLWSFDDINLFVDETKNK